MVQSLITATSASNARIAMAQNSQKLANVHQGLAAPNITDNPANAPAAAAVAFQMDLSIAALTSSAKNIAQGQALVQMATGALATIQNGVQQLNALAASANTVTLSDADRSLMDKEVQELITQINYIATSTKWNGSLLLDGSFTGDVQTGTTGTDVIIIALADYQNLVTGNVGTQADAVALETALAGVSTTVSEAIAELGSKRSRFTQIENSINVTVQNTYSARSSFADQDIPTLLEDSVKLEAAIDVSQEAMMKALKSITRLSEMVKAAKNI